MSDIGFLIERFTASPDGPAIAWRERVYTYGWLAGDIKAQAQYCHKSQIPIEGPGDGDIVDLARSRARYRGFESGVTYAEAFRFMPKPGMVRMAELLG